MVITGVDFLSPWVYYAFQVYTGHQSVLPILMFPAAYKCRFAAIPTLARLCKLLCRLPVLTLSSSLVCSLVYGSSFTVYSI